MQIRQHLIAIALFTLSLAAGLPGQISNPGTLTLYEDSVYRGQAMPIVLAAYPRNTPFAIPLLGDKVTSLRWNLGRGIRVTFFHDASGKGTQYRLTPSTRRVGGSSNIGSTHNDKFSSMMWQYEDPAIGGVIQAFDQSALRGASDVLPLASYPQSSVHRLWGIADKVTSLSWTLRPNVIVTFYEHPNGTGREYTVMHDRARGGGISNVGSYYNDKFSSFRWRVVDPSPGWVRFYTNSGFDGYHLTRYFSAPGSWSLAGSGYEDQIDSMKWSLPADRTVIAYRHSSLAGAGLPMRGTGQISNLYVLFSRLFHDSISSYGYYEGELDGDLSDRNAPVNENTYLCSNHASIDSSFLYTNGHYQTKNITWQLNYGARAFHIETVQNNGRYYAIARDWGSTVRMVRTSFGPETLESVLGDFNAWSGRNPDQVIFIRFETNMTGSALGDYLLQSPIASKIYVHRRGAWPTTEQLTRLGKRIVVFVLDHPTLMSGYGNLAENTNEILGGPIPRRFSAPIDRRHRPFFFMNRTTDRPVTEINPNNTANKLITLADLFPQRVNFVNIDEIQRGDHGLVAVRALNLLYRRATNRKGAQAYAHTFGRDCGTQATLQPTSDPILGQSLTLDFGSPSYTGLLLLGLSDVSSPLGALPAAVGNCSLRVSLDYWLPVTSAPSITLPVPNDPNLAGRNMFFQGTTPNVRLTEAARVHFGIR